MHLTVIIICKAEPFQNSALPSHRKNVLVNFCKFSLQTKLHIAFIVLNLCKLRLISNFTFNILILLFYYYMSQRTGEEMSLMIWWPSLISWLHHVLGASNTSWPKQSPQVFPNQFKTKMTYFSFQASDQKKADFGFFPHRHLLCYWILLWNFNKNSFWIGCEYLFKST